MFYDIFPELGKFLEKMKEIEFFSKEAAAFLIFVRAPFRFWKFLGGGIYFLGREFLKKKIDFLGPKRSDQSIQSS